MTITDELILHDYFLIQAITGGFFDGAKCMQGLGACYLLSGEESGGLLALAQSGEVAAINSSEEYNRYLRIRQYNADIAGLGGEKSAADRAITIKGGALELAVQYKVYAPLDAANNAVYKRITSAANLGVVPVLRAAGIMQCLGVFFRRDVSRGVEKLKKAADWNNFEAIIPLVAFDEGKRERYLNKLATLTVGTQFEDIGARICRNYGVLKAKIVKECRLLERAFGAGILQEDRYSPQHIKVLYGSALTMADRERLLLSEDKNAVSTVKTLPLNLSRRDVVFDGKALDGLALVRPDEKRGILRALNAVDLCDKASYRPLCLVSDSLYVAETYARAMTSLFFAGNVRTINAAELSASDFAPAESNAFISLCDEEIYNVFIITAWGGVDGEVEEAVKDFLMSNRRRHFRLREPSVTLDLSPVLPVLICDKQNARKYRELCDQITLSAVSDGEREAALNDVLRRKAAFYGVPAIDADRAFFDGMDVDEAERILDKAVRENRVKGQPLTLTRDLLEEYGEYGKSGNYFGFGGKRA